RLAACASSCCKSPTNSVGFDDLTLSARCRRSSASCGVNASAAAANSAHNVARPPDTKRRTGPPHRDVGDCAGTCMTRSKRLVEAHGLVVLFFLFLLFVLFLIRLLDQAADV